jgi:hypothetical protein
MKACRAWWPGPSITKDNNRSRTAQISIFLDESYFLEARKTGTSSVELLKSTEELNQILYENAAHYSKEFNELHDIIYQNLTIKSSVSFDLLERNTFTSNAFRNYLLLQLIRREQPSDCSFFTQDRTLNLLIKNALSLKPTMEDACLTFIYKAKIFVLGILRFLYHFVMLLVRRLRVSNVSQKKVNPEVEHVIFTFSEPHNIVKEGKFADRYFPNIAALSGTNPSKIGYILNFNSSKNIRTAAMLAKKTSNVLLVDEAASVFDYCADYFHHLVFLFKIFRLSTQNSDQKLSALTTLLLSEGLGRVPQLPNQGTAIAKSILKYFPNVKTVLNSFENLEYEKNLTSALKILSPDVTVVGYQHAAFTDTLLCSIPLPSEALRMPHQVITNGPLYYESLSKRLASFPCKIAEGPTLRYRAPNMNTLPSEPKKTGILFIASIEANETVWAVARLIESLFKSTHQRHNTLTVRLHPTTSQAFVQSKLQEIFARELPLLSRVTFSQGSFEDDIAQSSALYYQSPGSGLDLLRMDREANYLAPLFSLAMSVDFGNKKRLPHGIIFHTRDETMPQKSRLSELENGIEQTQHTVTYSEFFKDTNEFDLGALFFNKKQHK